MANQVLMSAQTTDAVGTGYSITGDFNICIEGIATGETVAVRMAIADTAARYKPIGTVPPMNSDGWYTVRNPGTAYVHAVKAGSLSGSAGVTVTLVQ